MKRLIMITTLAATACLFIVAGQAISAGQQNQGTSDSGTGQGMMNGTQQNEMMNGTQHQGMMGSRLNAEQIRKAQRLLNDKDLNVGAEDGILGKKTRTAIREFQKSQKLTANGTLDDPTLRALATTAQQQEFFGLSPVDSQPGN